MEPVRAGVWGVGVWGEKHARVYHALPGVTLVGVHDRDPERARAVAERHGCRSFASADELLEACEAVSIAVPTVEHRAAAERAAAAGRHALVEKPMAVTVEEADAMIAAARRARTVLQVGQVERFNPALLAARPHVRGPKFIEAHRLALFQPRSLDVDVVFDLMIHDLDAVLDVVGAAPVALSAVGVAVLSGNEDIANARLEFADGCVANLTASRVSQDRLRRIRFFQGDAYLSVDLFEKTCEMLHVDAARLRATLAQGGPAEAALAAIERRRLEVAPGEPLALELAAFLGSLRGQGGGAASAAAGRAALAVAAEVRAAMKLRARQWASRATAGS
ncbi:MAG: Gfo/Idh/MocA family oxidoreductase [Candidatus Eisenbacteria bacterium]|nr:Gfo/Idh/MocA family oxidoreductase [Candidatus Eisenbacteria bacterium]